MLTEDPADYGQTVIAGPIRRARPNRVTKLMETILHLGAHRTATSSFQAYLMAHRPYLLENRISYWGPSRTRKGLLTGVADRPRNAYEARRSAGRVQMNLASARRGQNELVLVSDENMMGSARVNYRRGSLYSDAGERMARICHAFQPVRRIILQIRSIDHWWSSAMGSLIPRGEPMPDALSLEAIARHPRSWRHVIADIACACPEAELIVVPFERFGGRPDRVAELALGRNDAPAASSTDFWYNRGPDKTQLCRSLERRGEDVGDFPTGEGRWSPFNDTQTAAMRETYADDLFWLQAGAEGLAKFREEPDPARPEDNLAAGQQQRGHEDERSAEKLARSG